MSTAGGENHCLTCSDEARPMRVLEVDRSALARCIDPDGAIFEVMVDLIGEVAAGDLVLVHAGVAIATGERRERPR